MLGKCLSLHRYCAFRPREILNLLSMVQGDVIQRPHHARKITRPMSGSLRIPYRCNILHRSKRKYILNSLMLFANNEAGALQSLGCIPRIPSPKVVFACSTSSTEVQVIPKTEASNVQDLEQENLDLRVRANDIVPLK